VELISDWVNLIRCIPPTCNRDGAERVTEFQIFGQDSQHMQNDKYRRKNCSMAENKIMGYNPDHPAYILYKYTSQDDHFKSLDLSKNNHWWHQRMAFFHTDCRQTSPSSCTTGRS